MASWKARSERLLLAPLILTGMLGCAHVSPVQQEISFLASDGATIHATRYGTAKRAVVLAHGGRFDKESWQEQAIALATAGFTVLAIDFRGYGESAGPGDDDPLSAPLHLDVLAAVQYLQQEVGASTVAAIGGSMGGTAVADAVSASQESGIDGVVLLGSGAGARPERVTGRKLLILSRDDANASGLRLPGILTSYEELPDPKEIIILEGSAHAQELFASEHSERVMEAILAFLMSQ